MINIMLFNQKSFRIKRKAAINQKKHMLFIHFTPSTFLKKKKVLFVNASSLHPSIDTKHMLLFYIMLFLYAHFS
jgi:hypothetical protein